MRLVGVCCYPQRLFWSYSRQPHSSARDFAGQYLQRRWPGKNRLSLLHQRKVRPRSRFHGWEKGLWTKVWVWSLFPPWVWWKNVKVKQLLVEFIVAVPFLLPDGTKNWKGSLFAAESWSFAPQSRGFVVQIWRWQLLGSLLTQGTRQKLWSGLGHQNNLL